MILCIGTTPAAQRVMCFKTLALDQVNRATVTLDGVAGKSINVAKVLKILGAEPFATGFLGGPRGEEIKRVLEVKGIRSEFLEVGKPTRQCITVIDEGTGTITELVEESRPLEPADFGKLIPVINRALRGAKAAIMSGTISTGGPVDFYKDCVARSRAAGALAVVDAQGAALMESLSAKPDLIKPNRQELSRTVCRNLANEQEIVSAMRELHKTGAQQIVVTAGKAPTLAFDGRTAWRIHNPEIRLVNPIGSGDSFTAALVWRLVQGDDLGECCRWAAATGAANALSLMPGELDRSDVERLRNETRVEQLSV